MHISIISMPALWLSISHLVTVALCGFPSLMPRRGFAINTVRNNEHVPNGMIAKAKALAKFAHLADSPHVKALLDDYDPCEQYS